MGGQRPPKDPGIMGILGGTKHLRSVPAGPADRVLAIRQARQLFTHTYLELLVEPDVIQHMRELLTTAKDGKEIGSMLNAILRAIVPPEDTLTTAVSVTLAHDIPRPVPVDVTPPRLPPPDEG
jgi:hypothetical protein